RGGISQEISIKGESDKTGTFVNFVPDPTIFTETTDFKYETLMTRVRELAFLNKGLRISIEDKREEREALASFYYEGGIKSYVEYLNESKVSIVEESIYLECEQDVVQVVISMQYTDTYHTNILSFANNIHTYEGGTHESGFKTALTRVMNDYAR